MSNGRFFPNRINLYIPDMQFDASVSLNDANRFRLDDMDGTGMVAADTDGILAAASLEAVASYYVDDFAAAYSDAVMGRYGRNVTVDCSGANTDVVVVHGFDYLGQPMRESITANGTGAVAGKKAFARVTQVDVLAETGVTLDLGWGNVLGLPYAMVKMTAELMDSGLGGVAMADAGTFVAAVTTDPQTATTGDPRGTWTPHSNNVPNGSRIYEIFGFVLNGNLHGVQHYNG